MSFVHPSVRSQDPFRRNTPYTPRGPENPTPAPDSGRRPRVHRVQTQGFLSRDSKGTNDIPPTPFSHVRVCIRMCPGVCASLRVHMCGHVRVPVCVRICLVSFFGRCLCTQVRCLSTGRSVFIFTYHPFTDVHTWVPVYGHTWVDTCTCKCVCLCVCVQVSSGPIPG